MAEFDNCKLLLVDKKITTARDIVGILEAAVRGSFPLMIMAEDIEQEALATMVVNKLRGTLKVGHSLPELGSEHVGTILTCPPCHSITCMLAPALASWRLRVAGTEAWHNSFPSTKDSK